MAPHGEAVVTSYPPKSNIDNTTNNNNNNNKKKANSFTRPPRLSNDSLQRTISDISFELLSKDIDEELLRCANNNNKATTTTGPATALPPISEVENAKCDCCGMEEEFTPEYITKVRDKFMGKWLCGLCSEAVKEEMDRSSPSSEPEPEEGDHDHNNKTQLEKALQAHMSHCARFNKIGRAFPVLCQAEAMRDLLKRSKSRGAASRAKSMSPKDYTYYTKGGVGKKVAAAGISRSSSCIPALTREISDVTTNFTANN